MSRTFDLQIENVAEILGNLTTVADSPDSRIDFLWSCRNPFLWISSFAFYQETVANHDYVSLSRLNDSHDIIEDSAQTAIVVEQ